MMDESYLRDMRVIRNVRVPMRDGVGLATSVWLPKGDGPFPIVLVRTAYNRVGGYGPEYTQRGIGLVWQDVRGRYASEGDFYPWTSEAEDGWDTIEWLTKQPWCNGSVGMFGASYLGGTQLAVAPLNHPAVKALNPQFIAGDLWRQGYYCNGVFSIALTFSWLVLEVGSRTSEANMMPQFNVKELLGGVPAVSLDERVGAPTQAYRDYVTHWSRDEFWQVLDYGPGLRDCRTPMLLTGGWYDYYPNETFRNYALLMRGDVPDEIKRQHRVIVGPWPHGHWPTGQLGDLDYGPEATKENNSTTRWLEALLKDGTAADYSTAPIRLFVMGENVWRDEQEWPLERTQWTTWYLHSGGRANSLLGDGALSPELPADESPDYYAFDPEHPVPTLGGNHSVGPYNPGLFEHCQWGPLDQRPIERRDDVLVYTSDVLAEELEVTGPIEVTLFVATSARDTDFAARLCDVYPDGRSINITEGVLRGRFRDHVWDKPRLMEPGEVATMKFELQPTSNLFKRGHRLRLDVTSSSFPLWAPNLNTGNDPATDTERVVAQQTVYHETGRASHVVLPVIPRG